MLHKFIIIRENMKKLKVIKLVSCEKYQLGVSHAISAHVTESKSLSHIGSWSHLL